MKSVHGNEQESVSVPQKKELNKNASAFTPFPNDQKVKSIPPNKDKNEKSQALESSTSHRPEKSIFNELIKDSDKIQFDEIKYKETLKIIYDLRNKEKRDEAFKLLSDRRETDKQLAVLLWHSVGTIAIILQEIIMAYPLLNNLNVNQNKSDKMSNVLGLFQCLALDSRTRIYFLRSFIISKPSFVCFSVYKFACQTENSRSPQNHQSRSNWCSIKR